jgi:HPt (histidine-containing phosphotransfer) domain-containing protein
MNMTHPNPVAAEAIFAADILLSHTAGHLILAHRLLNLYLADLPVRATALIAVMRAGDSAAVRQQAHTLKGASLTVGATGLAQLTQALEHAPELSTPSGLPELEKMFEATQAAMQVWMKTTPTGSTP